MEMDQKLNRQSKVILNDLVIALAVAFNKAGSLDILPDEDAVEALLKSLDDIGASRDFILHQANNNLESLLSNTANQIVQ